METDEIFLIIIGIIAGIFLLKLLTGWFHELTTRNELQNQILQELKDIKAVLKKKEGEGVNSTKEI